MKPTEAVKKETLALAKEQGGTAREDGSGNPFAKCEDPGKFTGHKSADYGGVSGNKVAGG